MSAVVISGTTSGTVTLQAPAVAGSTTITLPTTSGTAVTTGSVGAVTPTMLTTGAPSWDASGNLLFNSGYGSAGVAYGCRAWLSYNETGASVREARNVTSVTDNGTGDFTMNFTTAMPDSSYAAVTSTTQASGSTNVTACFGGGTNYVPGTYSTTQLRIQMRQSNGTLVDCSVVNVCVFR